MVERGGLENRCGPTVHRGFESLPLRFRAGCCRLRANEPHLALLGGVSAEAFLSGVNHATGQQVGSPFDWTIANRSRALPGLPPVAIRARAGRDGLLAARAGSDCAGPLHLCRFVATCSPRRATGTRDFHGARRWSGWSAKESRAGRTLRPPSRSVSAGRCSSPIGNRRYGTVRGMCPASAGRRSGSLTRGSITA